MGRGWLRGGGGYDPKRKRGRIFLDYRFERGADITSVSKGKDGT